MDVLSKIGIDYVFIANNHCLDNGVKGICSTLQSLDQYNIKHSGTCLFGKK